MTGLLVLILAAVWLTLATAVAYYSTKRIDSVVWRSAIGLLLFAVLLPLPLINEIVGKKQFDRLCEENGSIIVNRVTAVGRTVYFVPQPAVEIKGTWVRIVIKPKRFVDAATGETVLSYNELMADGGLFFRLIRISEGGEPFIFNGTCVPADRPGSAKTFEPFGITYIEPPSENTGEMK